MKNRDRSQNRSRKGGFGNRSDEFGGGFEPRGMSAPRADFGSRTPTVEHSSITSTVKWFNTVKGFGFVSPDNGTPDAFLHISALEQAGYQTVPEGATLVCDLGSGQRGPQVITVLSVDVSTASPTERPASSAPRRAMSPVTGDPVNGTVKFFSADKGFGFIASDEGGKDVFVHIKTLERSNIGSLTPDQRVRMTISQGQKGPQAETVDLL